MIIDKKTGQWEQLIQIKGETGRTKIVKWHCDCPDFRYRKLHKDSSGKTHAGMCKHISAWIESLAGKNRSLGSLSNTPANIAEIQKMMSEQSSHTDLSEKTKEEDTHQTTS